jgi:hypothetical protein
MATYRSTGRWPRAIVAAAIGASFGLAIAAASLASADPSGAMHQKGNYFLPDAAASREVTVTKGGAAAAEITVLTQAVAVKETGPKETVSRFGEVYSFSPSFIAVHRDQPTLISFWNLQPDDEHDFMLSDAKSRSLMHVQLPPLKRTSYVFTFHREGLPPSAR